MKSALAELGQREVTGAKSNSRILDYRRMARLPLEGEDSVVPWCAIFVNAMISCTNFRLSGSAMARSFANSPYFEKLDAPIVGCITVISSSRGPASGHVFFYTGENGLFIQGLGGNQNDEVNISMFQKKKLVGHYWPIAADKPNAPFDKPVRLARPLLPHEKKVRDV
jgi:uncharacterized protein (TIGR02594 family)